MAIQQQNAGKPQGTGAGTHPPSVANPVHPIYARLLRMLLQQTVADSDEVLAAAALSWDDLLKNEHRLSQTTVIRFVCAAMQATQKPWLGLELGVLVPISAHGPLGYAAVTAPTVQQSLEIVARYFAVREDSFVWTLQNTAGGASLQAVAQLDWGDAYAFMVDAMAASLVRMLQAALGSLPPGLVLDLPLVAPRWAAQYARLLCLDVRFGQPVLALQVPKAVLRLSCLGADAKAHSAACQECEGVLQELQVQSLSQRVAGLIARTPSGHYPQLTTVATACGVSERSLSRHLAQENSSFQKLLDVHQQTRARWLLLNTRQSVEDIAQQLGYQDTSNFSRTAKRWFGVTPSALRQGQTQTQTQKLLRH